MLAPQIARGDGSDATYALPALFDAESRHFWFTSRSALIAWAAARYFPRASSLLDVGCGSGGLLAALTIRKSAMTLTGADALIDGLRFARSRLPEVELMQLDARHLPFRDEFDLAGAFDVLEHLDDDESLLRQMHAAVRSGGGILVTVPQHPWLWSRSDDFSRHRRRYRRGEIEARVARAGFRVRRTTSFTTLMLPLMAASRVLDRSRRSPFDPEAELRVGSAVNAVGGTLSLIERLAIQSGVSLPIGGSRLVVAAKP
jgi:SAM-dependent methyltransferase